MTAYRSFCASLLILAGAGIVSCGLLSNSNTNMAAPEVSSLSENSDEDLPALYDNFRAKARKRSTPTAVARRM